MVERGVLLEGCCERRRCSRDTYPKSYITKYASIRRYIMVETGGLWEGTARRPPDAGLIQEVIFNTILGYENCCTHVSFPENCVPPGLTSV